MTEKKKKVEEDKAMAKEDKRVIATRLEERISTMQKLTNTQLDMTSQLMLANQKLNQKDMEIENLKSQNDILKNQLKTEKKFMERFNKPREAMKYF